MHRINQVVGIAVLCALNASAATIITNLPGNNGAGTAIGARSSNRSGIKAMGFTMPGTSYTLDEVILPLTLESTLVDPLVRIFDDVGGVPTNMLIELVDPVIGSVGLADYSFTPGATFTLNANTTYWVVVSEESSVGFAWESSSPFETPTGIATHAGARYRNDGTTTPPTAASSFLNSYEIRGTDVSAVPEPSALTLLALGLGAVVFVRRKRQRS